jgi:hypothetical protein
VAALHAACVYDPGLSEGAGELDGGAFDGEPAGEGSPVEGGVQSIRGGRPPTARSRTVGSSSAILAPLPSPARSSVERSPSRGVVVTAPDAPSSGAAPWAAGLPEGRTAKPASDGWARLSTSLWHRELLAAISHHGRLAISRDGGVSYVLLEGSFRDSLAAFGRDGALHVLAGSTLHTFSPDGTKARAAVHVEGRPLALHPTDAGLVLIGHRAARESLHLALSRDGGRSWRRLPMGSTGNAGYQVQVEPDGRVQMRNAHEATCGGCMYLRLLGDLKLDPSLWRTDAMECNPYSWLVGADGWSYEVGSEAERCKRSRICAVPPPGSGASDQQDEPDLRPVELLGVPAETAGYPTSRFLSGTLFVAVGRGFAVALLDGALVRLEGPRGRILAARTPPVIAGLAVDASGRPILLSGGRALRLDSAGVWTAILR